MKRRPHLRSRWIIGIALFLLPAALYWTTLVHRYGFRDDYSMLRESHEEPGKVTRMCAMQARPIYGVVLEHSLARLDGIDDLAKLRVLAAGLLGAVAAATFFLLCAAKWDLVAAALVAALITVMPGSQLLVGWTVGWPRTLALLLALAAFACGERAFGDARQPRRYSWWAAAVLLVTAGALTYQPDALFYFVPVAAALWPRRRWTVRTAFEWLVRHTVTVMVGLAAAFTVMMVSFATGRVPISSRVALEHDWPAKILWFVSNPLQNALSTIVLNDDDGSRFAHRAALLATIVLLTGVARVWQTRGWQRALWWLGALAALLVLSFSVNLVVDDRWPVYRVMLPMTGVILVSLAITLFTLSGRRIARLTLGLLLLTGGWLARQQAFALIAWPQGVELTLLERGAAKIPLAGDPSVFVITPTPFDHVASRTFSDEFGSLSTDSDWVPKEMLKLVMHEQHPGIPDIASRYRYDCGRALPASGHFDVVIDLRRVRDFRGLPVNRPLPLDRVMPEEEIAAH
jgi:hypothetical protein